MEGGRDCKLPDNEGHSENRVRITVLGMPQMSQMGPISKSCLFWVVTWPLGVEVAISTKMYTYVFFFTPRAFGWYLDVPLKVKCATLIVYSRALFTEFWLWV